MASTQDDAFREIQLSGKQLVFIAMAVVVIGVGVFLMGVQVGRGVLAARGIPGASGTDAAAVNATEAEPPPPPASVSAASSTTPTTAGEKLSYGERLGSSEMPKDVLRPESSAPPAEPPSPKSESTPVDAPEPAPAPAKAVQPAAALVAAKPAAASAAPVEKSAAVAEPAGPGFAIQVAALREADEANAIVKRLAGKGYPAYVVTPAKGAPSVYRVRVGKYKDRHEADTVAAKLQKEEQFKPWIVR